MPSQEYVYFQVEAENCKVICVCNGLPVMSHVFKGKSTYSLPINQILSKSNSAYVAVTPSNAENVDYSFPNEVTVEIRVFDQSNLVAGPASGKMILRRNIKKYSVDNFSFN